MAVWSIVNDLRKHYAYDDDGDDDNDGRGNDDDDDDDRYRKPNVSIDDAVPYRT